MRWCLLALWLSLLFAANPEVIADQPSRGLPFELEPVALSFSEELEIAKQAYLVGDWHTTVTHLREYLSSSQNADLKLTARFLLAESLAQLRRYDEAVSQFQHVLELTAESEQITHTKFRLAELAMFRGDLEKATELLQQFREDHPSHRLDAFALPYLARVMAAAGDTDRARLIHTQAVSKYPQGPLALDSRLRLALLDYDKGNFESSRRQLDSVVESTLTEDPLYWDAIYWLGMAELRLEMFSTAAELLLSVKNAAPNHRYSDASWYFAAQSLRQAGRIAEAANAYRELRMHRPTSEYGSHAILGEMQCLTEVVCQSNLAGNEQHDVPSQARALHAKLMASSAIKSLKDRGTRLFAQILLTCKEYEHALEQMYPLTERTSHIATNQHRQDDYQNLYLAALALRGVGKSAQASELLGRVRLRLCSQSLAGQVRLARMQTAIDLGDSLSAVETGLAMEADYAGSRIVDSVRAELVRAYIEANRLRDAKATFLQMQQQPTSQSSLMQAARGLAEATYAADDLVNARRIYDTLLRWKQNDDDHIQALSGLAWIDTREGLHDNAVTRFERLLELFPNHGSNSEARRMLAKNLIAQGEIDKAISILSNFRNVMPEDSQRAAALYQLGLLLQTDPQTQPEAVTVIQQLLEEHSTYERRDAALYLLGTVQDSLGASQATETFLQIVNRHPTSRYWSDALYRLAEIHARERSPLIAHHYLSRLVAAGRSPRVMPHALYFKGRLETGQQQWSDARASLREIIQKYPTSPLVTVARYGVAETFFQEKQFDHAAKLFEILSKASLPTDEPWRAMIRLRRAQLLVKQEAFLEAIHVAQTIRRDFGSFPLQHEADYLLGRAHAGRGEFHKARKAYGRVVAADPGFQREISAIAQWMVGESHFHQKNFELAIASFEKVVPLETYPSWQALSLLQIGKCYEALQQSHAARQVFSQLAEDFAGTEVAGEATYRRSVMTQPQEQKAEK